MAVTNDDFNQLVESVNSLYERVEALENPADATGEVADDDISDATVRDWVKSQIALSGGLYVTESAPEGEAKANG